MTRVFVTWLMAFSLLLGGMVPNAHASVCVAPEHSTDSAETLAHAVGDSCCEAVTDPGCCAADMSTGCSDTHDEAGDEPCSDRGCDCPSSCCVQLAPAVTALPGSPAAADFTVSTRATEVAPQLAAHGYHQDIVWPPIA